MNPEHLQIDADDVSLHLACQGEGPLVIMCHGYPGLWYSWRHQLPAVAAAGFRAVALDMRGYGRSSRPLQSDAYALDRTSADVFAVLDFFNERQAVLVGHDFGANLAWHMWVHHPDRIRAIAPMCVPYEMPLAGGSDIRPSQLYAAIAENHFLHMHYYQKVGVAEASGMGREREFLSPHRTVRETVAGQDLGQRPSGHAIEHRALGQPEHEVVLAETEEPPLPEDVLAGPVIVDPETVVTKALPDGVAWCGRDEVDRERVRLSGRHR